MSNIRVGSDEERKINEILDRGIDEIKLTSGSTILKSSIIDDKKDSNFNFNYPGYEEDNNSNLSYSKNGSSKCEINNNRETDTNVKSSALRQLLDEMKMSNKFLSSSDDEAGNCLRFKGNSTNVSSGIAVSVNKSNNHAKNNRNYLGTGIEYNLNQIEIEDEPNLKSPQNINFKFINDNHVNINNKLLAKENENRFINDNSSKNRTINAGINVNNLPKFGNKYKNSEANIFNKNLINLSNNKDNDKLAHKKNTKNNLKVKSESHTDLIGDNELSFQDMHCDIKHLQDKISGLERKLVDGYNSSNISNFNAKTNLESDFEFNSSFSHKNLASDRVNRFSSNLKKSENKQKGEQDNIISLTRDILQKSSQRLGHSKIIQVKSMSNRSNSSNISNGSDVSKLKNRYENIKELNDTLKHDLISERKKNFELNKKNKKMQKKEEAYDQLKENYNITNQKLKDTLFILDESELIRKEQAKMIKSLQREIYVLRSIHTDEENKEKLEYKGIKKEYNGEEEIIKISKKQLVKKKKNKSQIENKSRSKSTNKTLTKPKNNLKNKIHF